MFILCLFCCSGARPSIEASIARIGIAGFDLKYSFPLFSRDTHFYYAVYPKAKLVQPKQDVMNGVDAEAYGKFLGDDESTSHTLYVPLAGKGGDQYWVYLVKDADGRGTNLEHALGEPLELTFPYDSNLCLCL